MTLKNIIVIAKKEFFSFINSPLAYTIAVPFLFLTNFLYLRQVLVVGEATMRPYFELLPWFLLLLAPALSMKLLTDEYRGNTLELLFAHPISELELVVGKFAGALAFYAGILAATAGLPLSLLIFSRPDLGQIAGQYIGAILVGATFIAVGIACSAIVKNAVSSFLLSAAVSFILLIVGMDFIALMLPFPVNRIAAELSVFTHLENVAKGLLDIRDLAYFVTVSGLFLLLACVRLSQRKLAENAKEMRKMRLSIVILLAIGVVFNILLSFYPIRIDATSSRLFTLSDGTKQTLGSLPDILTVTVYASSNLPSQMQLSAREVHDLLSDYRRISSRVQVREVHPDTDPAVAREAQNAGIQEVTFNRIGTGKFEVQTGFLGISIRYGEKMEAIPFVSDTTDLEYQLTRRIRKITAQKEQTIGIMQSGAQQASIFERVLSTQYKTVPVSTADAKLSDDLSALIVIDDGSGQAGATASATIKNILLQKGKVLLLVSGVSINTSQLLATNSTSALTGVLSDWGVKVNNDLVYDLELNELLTFGSGQVQYLTPYPYFLKALPAATDLTPLSGVRSVTLGWPSSVTIEEKPGISYKRLLTTGVNSGKVENSYSIAPDSVRALSSSAKEKILLAASAEKDGARAVVVGNASFVADRFLQNSQDNVAFLSGLVDWLAAPADLAGIPSRIQGRAVFEFSRPADIYIVQYGNLLAPPLLFTGFALWYLRRRKKLTKRLYG